MKLSDLNNLSVENIGSWPTPVKVAGALLVAGIIIGVGWSQLIDPLQTQLEAVRKTESELRLSFETKQKKAANLPALKQQLLDIQEQSAVPA